MVDTGPMDLNEDVMPGWLPALLKWGGTVGAIISVITVIYVGMVTPPPEGGDSGAPMTRYVMFIGWAGLAAVIAGWLLERRKGSSGSGSSGS